MNTQPLYNELLDLLQTQWMGLADKPEENPELTLKALWMLADGAPMSVQKIAEDGLRLPEAVDEARLRQLVEQRLAGTPLAYLTERQSFMGIEMLAGPEAMIPRKETELLGQAALRVLRGLAAEQGATRAIDVCTGSGNLALALAFLVPGSSVYGVDIHAPSVELACRNAEFLGLNERVHFSAGDLFEPLEADEFYGQADLVTCNPPYISSRRVETMPHEISGFEPRPAFDGGPFGITIMSRLVKDAPRFLRPGGQLCFEVGLGQGETMARTVQKTGAYGQIETLRDPNGDIRVIAATLY